MVNFVEHSQSSAAEAVAQLVELYSAVYALPPYSEGPEQLSRFQVSIREEIDRKGFKLITANSGRRMVGAAYGWTMSANSWWSGADRVPDKVIYEANKFAVMEWLVHPNSRNAGIGRELLRRLLNDRPEGYATLASDPRSEARAIYARAGWWEAAKSRLPWGAEMDLLVKELPSHAPDQRRLAGPALQPSNEVHG